MLNSLSVLLFLMRLFSSTDKLKAKSRVDKIFADLLPPALEGVSRGLGGYASLGLLGPPLPPLLVLLG